MAKTRMIPGNTFSISKSLLRDSGGKNSARDELRAVHGLAFLWEYIDMEKSLSKSSIKGCLVWNG